MNGFYGSSAHYSSSFILTAITDQPIIVIAFHVIFFVLTQKTNYFESFCGALMASICFSVKPPFVDPDHKQVLSVEYVLLLVVVFCMEYFVNILGFPIAFICLIVYFTVFKLNEFYCNMYCLMTLIQIIVSNYFSSDHQVVAYLGLSTVTGLGVLIWKRIK